MTNITTQESLKLAAMLPAAKGLVKHGHDIYQSVHWEDELHNATIPAEERIWKKLNLSAEGGDIRAFVEEYGYHFQNAESYKNFLFQLRGRLLEAPGSPDTVLIKADTLLQLGVDGKLVLPDGEFKKNYIRVPLNEDPEVIREVFDVFTDWLGSDVVAHSLLHHLATALAPAWTPVKYVILIGEGSNGKSILLTMLEKLFGKENVSRASRQAISAGRPLIAGLNHSLINIVGDGSAERITDSSNEKALTAGEPIWIEKKFENDPIEIQTNALFIEALNREPNNREDSYAMDRRLVRFAFNKRYAANESFRRRMLSDEVLGALLMLLIEHYVLPSEAAEKLVQTQESLSLQAEHKLHSSRVLQFLVEDQSAVLQDLVDKKTRRVLESSMVTAYHVWLGNKKYNFSRTEAMLDLRTVFERKKTTRGVDKTIDYNYTAIKDTMARDIAMLLQHANEENDDIINAVVGDE